MSTDFGSGAGTPGGEREQFVAASAEGGPTSSARSRTPSAAQRRFGLLRWWLPYWTHHFVHHPRLTAPVFWRWLRNREVPHV